MNYLPYGPQGESGASCEIVSSYGPVELEYASIRRDCGLFDASHRALIQLSGSERLDFLDRMLTQKIADLAPGSVTRSFWLNRKGGSSPTCSSPTSRTGPSSRWTCMPPKPPSPRSTHSSSPRTSR